MKSSRTSPLAPLLALGLLLVLGLLFVPECDDCYFVFWDFASWQDFLLTRPITQGAKVVGVPANGRYLGNLLGVLQGKLYFTPVGFVRGLLMGAALAVLALLMGQRFRCAAVSLREGFFLAFALIVLAPRGIWQQVYAWGAGLVNYLLPMVGILVLVRLLEGKRRCAQLALLFFIALSCCLFMEPVTIYLALGGLALVLWAWLARRPLLPAALALFLGSGLGALVMFSAPGYAQAGSDTRSIGLELAWHNLHIIVTETLVRPAAVTMLISALLVWLLKRQGCPRWPLWGALLALVHLACAADTVIDLPRAWGLYTTVHLALGCALALLWLAALAEWKGGPQRGKVLVLALSLCLINGPLLFVSPVGPRNFFPSYIFLLLTAALLYREARGRGLRPQTWLSVPAALAGVLLVLVYACNFWVYHQRLTDARQQVAQGAQELTLPLLPFPGWVTNELPGKGDISYLIYRDTPWDVAFQFVPYGQWPLENP